MKFFTASALLISAFATINGQFFGGNGGMFSGGLVGSILGSVFGGGSGGVGVGYGGGGLVGGILGSVFGNGCNPGIIGAVFGSGGYNPQCYYSIYNRGRGASPIKFSKGEDNTSILEISGLPKTEEAPKGILKIEGEEKSIINANGQYRLDPNAQFKMTYL